MRGFRCALLAMIAVLTPMSAIGQSSQPSSSGHAAVIIRNVRVSENAHENSKVEDVLIVGTKITPLAQGSVFPSGATVIDGGGSRLTVIADGHIKLTPLATSEVPKIKKAEGQPVSGPTAKPQASAEPEENLAQKVTDPTAALKTLTFQNKYTPSLWGVDDNQNEMDMQLAVPIQFLGRSNILRVTLPYMTSLPSGNRGLSDVSIFDIMLFPKKWGTPVAGVVVNFGTNKGPGVDTFAIGPAAGVVFKKEKWTYGVFNQNLFSAESIATTQIQPILAYTVNQRLSVAFGDQQFTYDWKKDRFALVPVGFQVNYIARFGNQPVRFLFGPQYNIKNEFGARKWTITTGFALILR